MSTPAWKTLLADSITTADALCAAYPQLAPQQDSLRRVISRYPLRINPYYQGLFSGPGDALWKQAVPDPRELQDTEGLIDPLAEEAHAPVANITHRYPDRVLFLVSNACALHCRFCTRKRKTGTGFAVNEQTIRQGLDYIRSRPEVRDVLVSGGDPLLLENEQLAAILDGLRSIAHVEIIRIGSRIPCVLPQRITPELARMLSRFQPVYINTHFNHPAEITPAAASACALLSDAGIPLGCQTVLLKGVNDTPAVIRELMQRLLAIRVRPYYLHHMDCTLGTRHFRTGIQAGLDIVRALRGHTSGMCVPHYVIDLPGGGGKVPLTPEYVVGVEQQDLLLKNYQGELFKYRLSREDREQAAALFSF
ncbi:KamA family radical SAM protein [Thermodesulfobacteriota bacterium]